MPGGDAQQVGLFQPPGFNLATQQGYMGHAQAGAYDGGVGVAGGGLQPGGLETVGGFQTAGGFHTAGGFQTARGFQTTGGFHTAGGLETAGGLKTAEGYIGQSAEHLRPMSRAHLADPNPVGVLEVNNNLKGL